ncbi:hypothetical protein AAIH70_28685 [Neorhizobium sp. BT27B]|uniref:hypothetical protein n=1 Tax=Neorhizobium sp. BT27B TaxID=3142625 RepID=UPI003D282A0A
MESFKLYRLENIARSWGVLGRFPGQVLVLKGNRGSSLVDPATFPIANEFIDREQTSEAESFHEILAAAVDGNEKLQKQLAMRGEWADEHIARIMDNSAEIGLDISEFLGLFTPIEVKRIRTRQRWQQDTAEKFLRIVCDVATRTFEEHHIPLPNAHHLADAFIFRFTLAQCVYLMELVRRGTLDRKAELVRNDVIDISYTAYSTYFDGFMSSDGLAATVHNRTRFLLRQQGAQVPPQLF